MTGRIRVAAAVLCMMTVFLCSCRGTEVTGSKTTDLNTVWNEDTSNIISEKQLLGVDQEAMSESFDLELYETPVKPWYLTDRLIRHACGGIDGMAYTNSKEAIESALSVGDRLIEVDFLFTSDDHLVCVHKWDELIDNGHELSLDKFLKQRIYSRFTPMTAEDIISFMEAYPSLYIIVDTKERDLSDVVQYLIQLCHGQTEIVDRFIIQVYGRNMKDKLMEVYPFQNENIILSCYKFGPERYYELLNICKEDNISIVTIPQGSWDKKVIDLFLEKEIILFEHTVNESDQMVRSLDWGVYGFYTDFIQHTDIQSVIN